MLDSLVTPVVAVAIILAITFPIWFLVLLVRFVHEVRRIADALTGVCEVLQRARIYGEVDNSPVEFERTGLGQPK